MFSCDKEPRIAYNFNIDIPDSNFKAALIETYVYEEPEGLLDANRDGEISDGEAARISNLILYQYGIKDLTGINAFRNLKSFHCEENQIKSLSISIESLRDLVFLRNETESIDISGCTKLSVINCSFNKLQQLDLSNNTLLEHLTCSDNELQSVDISNNTKLDWLFFRNNNISSIDLSNNTELTYLNIADNDFSIIDLTHNLKLESILFKNNNFQNIDFSNLAALKSIWIGGNQFTFIDISNNTEISFIRMDGEEPFLEQICVWVMPFPTPEIHLVGIEDESIFKICD